MLLQSCLKDTTTCRISSVRVFISACSSLVRVPRKCSARGSGSITYLTLVFNGVNKLGMGHGTWVMGRGNQGNKGGGAYTIFFLCPGHRQGGRQGQEAGVGLMIGQDGRLLNVTQVTRQKLVEVREDAGGGAAVSIFGFVVLLFYFASADHTSQSAL